MISKPKTPPNLIKPLPKANSLFLTAKEANEKTKTAIVSKDQEIITDIFNKITEATKNGEFFVNISTRLSSKIKEFLESYGYEVTETKNDDYWNEVNDYEITIKRRY